MSGESKILKIQLARANERIAKLEATLWDIFNNREVLTSDEWDSMERIFQRGMTASNPSAVEK